MSFNVTEAIRPSNPLDPIGTPNWYHIQQAEDYLISAIPAEARWSKDFWNEENPELFDGLNLFKIYLANWHVLDGLGLDEALEGPEYYDLTALLTMADYDGFTVNVIPASGNENIGATVKGNDYFDVLIAANAALTGKNRERIEMIKVDYDRKEIIMVCD